MVGVQRTAQVVWTNDLVKGSGQVTVGTGAFGPLPVTWAARTEAPNGKTSPEELLAGAHAACYAMALASTLTQRGTPPTRLTVAAACTFERVAAGWKITTMELEVRGNVPGLDAVGFDEAAREGEQACPVSNALRNNVDIRLRAQLE
jgi:osmotically inducible protein OsmC